MGEGDNKTKFILAPATGRILRHPQIRKGHIELELCTNNGIEKRIITHKDKELYRKAKNLAWGSSLD